MWLKFSFIVLLSTLAGCAGISGGKQSIDKGMGRTAERSIKADAYNHYLSGIVHAKSANYNKAIAEYRKASDIDPDALSVHIKLIHAYLLLQDRDNALVACKRAIECSPSNIDLWATKGRVHLVLKQYDEAEESFQKVVELAPTNLRGYKTLIAIFDNLNDLVGTVETLEKLIEIQPNSSNLYLQYASKLLQLNEIENARSAIEKALKLEPGLEHAHFILGVICMDAGEIEKAIDELGIYLDNVPEDVFAMENLVGAYARTEDYEEALRLIEKVLSIDWDNPKYDIEQTYLLLKSGRYQGIKNKSQNEETPILSAFFKAIATKYEGKEYLPLFESLDEIQGNIDTETTTYLSSIISVFGKEEAGGFLLDIMDELNESQIHSKYVDIIHARINMILQRHKEAEPILLDALERYGDGRWLHYYLAAVYEELKDFEKTESHLKSCLEFEPDDPDLLNFLGYLYADNNIKLDEAESLLNHALEITPNSPYYLDSIGWLYYRKGEVDKAIDNIRKAVIEMEIDDGILRDHLGDAFLLKGEVEKAVEEWRRVRRLTPELEGVQEKIDEYSVDISAGQ